MINQSVLRHRTSSRERRGTATAELAVCLPIITLFVFATIEACMVIHLKQTCTVAAYEGSRTALLPGALETDVTSEVNSILQDRNVTGGGVTVTPTAIETLPVGDYMKIEVSASCDQNTPLGGWFYTGRSVSAVAEVMKEF